MHLQQLTEVEQRVLGCLIEKRWTTPEQYPLSVNSLRLACNQSTNRDPVTRYTEDEVYAAAQPLSKYGLVRLASGHSSRATKYRHLAEEGLGLDRQQLALMCVLLLRGPQTPGELKQRSERMVAAPLSLDDVNRVLETLSERGYATNLGRRPGQKEDRFAHLLGGEAPAPATGDEGYGAGLAPGGEGDGAGLAPGGEGDGAGLAPGGEGGVAAFAPRIDDRAGAASAAAARAELDELRGRVSALEAAVAGLREQLDELLD